MTASDFLPALTDSKAQAKAIQKFDGKIESDQDTYSNQNGHRRSSLVKMKEDARIDRKTKVDFNVKSKLGDESSYDRQATQTNNSFDTDEKPHINEQVSIA